MSKQSRFMAFCLRNGESATISNSSGTACPCWNWRGSGYSPEYHRLYPASANCNGTGLVSSSTAQTSVKAFFYPLGVVGIKIPEDIKTVIGETVEGDLIMYGTANASTAALVDISALAEQEDYIAYNSKNYKVRKVYDMPHGTGQVAILVRK